MKTTKKNYKIKKTSKLMLNKIIGWNIPQCQMHPMLIFNNGFNFFKIATIRDKTEVKHNHSRENKSTTWVPDYYISIYNINLINLNDAI